MLEKFREWQENRRIEALKARQKSRYSKDFEKLKAAKQILVGHFGKGTLKTEAEILQKLWATYKNTTPLSTPNDSAREAALTYTAALLSRMEKKPAARKLLRYFSPKKFRTHDEAISNVEGKEKRLLVGRKVTVYHDATDNHGSHVNLGMNFDQFKLSFKRYDLKDRAEVFQDILSAGTNHPYFAYLMRIFVNDAHDPKNLIDILSHKNYKNRIAFLAIFISYYSDPNGASHAKLSKQELGFFFKLFVNNPRLFSVDDITSAIKQLDRLDRHETAASLIMFFKSQAQNEDLSLENRFFCLDISSRLFQQETIDEANKNYLEQLKSQAKIAAQQIIPRKEFNDSFDTYNKLKKMLPMSFSNLSADEIKQDFGTPQEIHKFFAGLYTILCCPEETLPEKNAFNNDTTVQQCCDMVTNRIAQLSQLLETLRLVTSTNKIATFGLALHSKTQRSALIQLALLPGDPHGARQFLEAKSKPGFFSRVSRTFFWWTESNKKEIELTNLAKTAFEASYKMPFSDLPPLVQRPLPEGSEEEMQPHRSPTSEVVKDYSNWKLAVIPEPGANIKMPEITAPVSSHLELPGLIPPHKAIEILREHSAELRIMMENVQAERKQIQAEPIAVAAEVKPGNANAIKDTFHTVLAELIKRSKDLSSPELLRTSGENSPRSFDSEELEEGWVETVDTTPKRGNLSAQEKAQKRAEEIAQNTGNNITGARRKLVMQ